MQTSPLQLTSSRARHVWPSPVCALGLHRRALVDFMVAVKLAPNNADALYSKGETEINLGLYKDAFLTLRQALQLNPQVRAHV